MLRTDMHVAKVVAYVLNQLLAKLLWSQIQPVKVYEFIVRGHQVDRPAVVVQNT